MCVKDHAALFSILSMEVDSALLYQVFNTIVLTISNCVEDRCLSLSVEIICITSLLYEILHDFFVTFSSSIENGCLAIAVGVIGLAAMFKEQLH